MGERVGGRPHAPEGIGGETRRAGSASELLSCQATYATRCSPHRHSCAIIKGLLRGSSVRGSTDPESRRRKKQQAGERSFIDFEGEVDRFAHGTSVPCRAKTPSIIPLEANLKEIYWAVVHDEKGPAGAEWRRCQIAGERLVER